MESDLAHPNIAATQALGSEFGTALAIGPVVKFSVPSAVEQLFKAMAIAGGLTLLAGAFLAPHRTWANLLLASYYLLDRKSVV